MKLIASDIWEVSNKHQHNEMQHTSKDTGIAALIVEHTHNQDNEIESLKNKLDNLKAQVSLR